MSVLYILLELLSVFVMIHYYYMYVSNRLEKKSFKVYLSERDKSLPLIRIDSNSAQFYDHTSIYNHIGKKSVSLALDEHVTSLLSTTYYHYADDVDIFVADFIVADEPIYGYGTYIDLDKKQSPSI